MVQAVQLSEGRHAGRGTGQTGTLWNARRGSHGGQGENVFHSCALQISSSFRLPCPEHPLARKLTPSSYASFYVSILVIRILRRREFRESSNVMKIEECSSTSAFIRNAARTRPWRYKSIHANTYSQNRAGVPLEIIYPTRLKLDGAQNFYDCLAVIKTFAIPVQTLRLRILTGEHAS